MISGEDAWNDIDINDDSNEVRNNSISVDLNQDEEDFFETNIASKLTLNVRSDNVIKSISDEPRIKIIIDHFEKKNEGMSAYIIYKIVTQTNNVLGYANKEHIVWRRFSDFLGLHEKLNGKYFYKGILVPAAPEKSLYALTKTKMNQNADETNAVDFAERRARMLQRFCMRITRHPALVSDCDFRDFLTVATSLPKAISTAAISGAGLMRMFKSLGDVFTKIAYHMDENDRWFESAQQQVDDMEQLLTKLLRTFESIISYRRELAFGTESFSKALSMLASCEENTGLARALAHFTETHENIAHIHNLQAEKDCSMMSEAIYEQLQIIYTLKELFFERVKIWQSWQSVQQNLTKKREAKARQEISGRIDRASQSREELSVSEKCVDEAEKEFVEVSKVIRTEYERYMNERNTDLNSIFSDYISALLETQTSLLQQWEKFAPEARAIALS